MIIATTAGRPVRALHFAGLALLLWIAIRLPMLEVQVRTTIAALQPPADILSAETTDFPATAPPALLVLATLQRPMSPRPILPLAARPQIAADRPPSLLALRAAPSPMRAAPPPQADRQPGTPLPNLAAASSAEALATAAYARLAAGDRRAAAGLFDAALAAGPDPRAPVWRQQRNALRRRWSGEIYLLSRDSGPGADAPGAGLGTAASPVLGGGQAGANLAWTRDPLARRPLAAIVRLNAATDSTGGIDRGSAQAAVGIRWRPLPGISVAAERLIAIGDSGIDDWSLRVAAGAQGTRGRAEWSGYGEAAALGNGDIFAGAQTRAGVRAARLGRFALTAGAGGWGSVQVAETTSYRIDIGPTIIVRTAVGRANLEVAADWRFRVAGNAAPGSGPAVTVSTGF